jgi:hypothetical protein
MRRQSVLLLCCIFVCQILLPVSGLSVTPPRRFVPIIVQHYSLSNQTASLSDVDFFTPNVDDVYRITYFLVKSSLLVCQGREGILFSASDGTMVGIDVQQPTSYPAPAIATTTVLAKAGVPFTYSTSLNTGSCSGTPLYSVDIVVEQMSFK